MIKNLHNKQIIVGITGSIAAYKSAYLVRYLQSAGALVQVVMSKSATQFIAPLTFQALTNNPVFVHETSKNSASGMLHIELAKWAELIIIAPATADFIARLATGRADDLLSALCLASTATIAIAPAMNQQMWHKNPTKININTLKNNGILILEPDDGKQACGDIGIGRMLEPDIIVHQLANSFKTKLLSGKIILITAGATCEPIDAMRFLSNNSTGKMGCALAQIALEMGATVELILGTVSVTPPDKANITQIKTANEMLSAVLEKINNINWFIGVAAVADYRPKNISKQKIKKTNDDITLTLTPNSDILQTVANHKNRPDLVVGFAAETENLISNAQQKLIKKNVDIIIANQIGNNIGVGTDDNAVSFIGHNFNKSLALAHKTIIARQILELLAKTEIN